MADRLIRSERINTSGYTPRAQQLPSFLSAASTVSAGLGELGRQALAGEVDANQRAVQAQERIDRANVAAWLADQTAREQEYLASAALEFRQEAQPSDTNGYTGLSRQFIESQQERVNERLQSIQDPALRAVFAERMARLTSSVSMNMMEWEAVSNATWRKERLERSIASHTNAVLSDPDLYDDTLAIVVEDIQAEAGNLDALALSELQSVRVNQLTAARMEGLIAEGSAELALAELESGEFDDRLEPATKLQLMRAAQSQVDAQRREAETTNRVLVAAAQREMQEQIEVAKAGRVPAGTDDVEPFIEAIEARQPDLVAEYRYWLGASATLEAFSRMPLIGQRAELERLRREAGGEPLSKESMDLLSSLQRIADETARLAREDPLQLAQERQVVSPALLPSVFDGADEGRMLNRASLRVRRGTAADVAEMYGSDPSLLFTGIEVQALRQRFQEAGSSEERTAMLGQLAQDLRTEEIRSLAGMLAEDSPTLAMAMGLAQEVPQAAAGILRGQELIDSGEITGITQENVTDAFDGSNELRRAMQSGRAGFRADVVAAANALYVSMLEQEGELPASAATFDLTMYRTALRGILGDPIRFNGTPTFPPVRGMTERELMRGISRLTPELIEQYARVYTRYGEAVPYDPEAHGKMVYGASTTRDVDAKRLHSASELRIVGDGLYLFRWSRAAARASNVGGSAIVFDLGALFREHPELRVYEPPTPDNLNLSGDEWANRFGGM